MTNFSVEATPNTPKVDLNAEQQLASFEGSSYPENVTSYYEPIIQWFEEYLSNNKTLTFKVKLVYFNSSSSKILFDIFEMLDEAAEQGSKISIQWIYDDENETSEEYGEEFAEDLEHVTFEMIKED